MEVELGVVVIRSDPHTMHATTSARSGAEVAEGNVNGRVAQYVHTKAKTGKVQFDQVDRGVFSTMFHFCSEKLIAITGNHILIN